MAITPAFFQIICIKFAPLRCPKTAAQYIRLQNVECSFRIIIKYFRIK